MAWNQSNVRSRADDAATVGLLHWAALAVVVVVLALFYRVSLTSLWEVWATQNYRHGYLIPLVSGWLIWQSRERLAGVAFTGSWLGALALMMSVWIWAISRVALVQSVEHVCVILILNAAVWTVVGMRAYRILAFPLLYLLFAVPIGETPVPVLMHATAEVAYAVLRLFDVTVFRQEFIMSLPGGTFVVADVCSGIAYVSAGLAMATPIAYLEFRSVAKRVLFVVAAGFGYVVMNGVRAALTMMVASATHMRYFIGYDHVLFGWFLFLLAMLGVFWVGHRWSDREPVDGD